MNNKNTRNIIIGLVVLLLIVLIGIRIYDSGSRQNNQQPADQTQVAESQEATTTTNSNTTPANARLAYTKAVDTYKNRFQFSGCHADPGVISVKVGVPVMLDNRDAKAHTIKANGQTFRIAGYDYAVVYPKIATVGSVSPDSSNVTCDGGGSATLNVEK